MLSDETKRELGAFYDLFSVVRQFQQAEAASSHNASSLVVRASQPQRADVQWGAAIHGLQKRNSHPVTMGHQIGELSQAAHTFTG